MLVRNPIKGPLSSTSHEVLYLCHGFVHATDIIILDHIQQTPAVNVKGQEHGGTVTCIYLWYHL